MIKSFRTSWFIAALLIIFLCCGTNSGKKKHRIKNDPHTKVLILGIDVATFSIIHPLISQGRLPHIKKLIEGGSYGILKSELPMMSPALWTTIATGVGRQEHGIKEFINKDDRANPKLYDSNDRHVSALWNWMGLFRKTTGFVSWWASWPAEPVNGWMISDRMARSRWTEWTNADRSQNLTFPIGLADELKPLSVYASDPPMEEIHKLVQLTESEEKEFLAAEKPIRRHGLSVFKFSYCEQRSYENISLYLLDKGQPDLTGVFLISNDPISHTFWHFYEPDKFENVNPQDAKRLGQLIPNIYIHNDQFLEKLLQKLDSDTIVMIVSDHGFEASGELPKDISAEEFDGLRAEAVEKGVVAIGQSGQHSIDGVIIAYGGPIRKGIKINASIFDVTPTVLALMGLPVGKDMKGRVLEEIIDPEFLAQYPIQTITSYEDLIGKARGSSSGRANEQEIIDKLRALGYIN